jgi:phage terminase large subunit-like protein
MSESNETLVAVEIGLCPHIDVIEAWERPPDMQGEWKVPILDVEEKIRESCLRWQVREIVCDPYRWARSMEVLEGEGLPVVEFPQSPSRMTPATVQFSEAVVNQTLTQSGDLRLARHIGNCILRVDSRGSRVSKEHKQSSRKIDLAVAAIMAHDRAFESADMTPSVFYI